MKIPNSFKQAISNTFYDKEVDIYSYTTETDDGGQVRRTLSEESDDSFLGNVRFTNLVELQEEYGLKEEVVISISTESPVEVGTPIGYDGTVYRVIKSIPRDSHNIILGTRW